MDVQEFWQENKRWVLGVLAGGVLFAVANSSIEGIFGAHGLVNAAQVSASGIKGMSVFAQPALQKLREEHDKLSAIASSVRARVGFVPDPDFVLAGKGGPDTYFPEIARRVRTRVIRAAQENAVDFAESNLVWASASGPEEIETRLLELGVLEAAAMRLFDASIEVRAAEPDALGLQSIESIKIESGRRGTALRPRKTKETEVPIVEYDVSFQFRCDAATLQSWLERLRAQKPVLGIALDPPLQATAGEQIGDPIRVKCTVQALVVRES
ncbi:MAG: hypothetical protein U1F36_05300 [Planctomycetota bacterium]